MIGLDHFARAGDELACAVREGTLRRNFMGYATHTGEDMLAFGVSSIGRIGRDFAQNVKTTDEYEAAIDSGNLPVQRGMRLSDEDLARERVIQSVMCYGIADCAELESRGVDVLADENTRRRLEELEADELIERHANQIRVTALGRYFLRNVAMVFDGYLGKAPAADPGNGSPVQIRFSRTV
jgi:oxygen-independent coproporphyrinogen-3 oxidase